MEDHENKKWVAREGLTLATAKRAGDYRRVTATVWKVILKLYPGSGPAITGTFDPVCVCCVDFYIFIRTSFEFLCYEIIGGSREADWFLLN